MAGGSSRAQRQGCTMEEVEERREKGGGNHLRLQKDRKEEKETASRECPRALFDSAIGYTEA